METPRPIRWETITKKTFDRLDPARCVVMVTCSPLEVHGPHLPLGADALEGEGLAERSLRFLPDRHKERTFLKLPFIYAATDTVPQPGSLYFQPATTVSMLTDLGRTLGAQGFKDVFVSNFHGGPRHFLAIEKACERANRRYGTRMVSLFSLLIARLTNGTSNLDDVLAEIPGVRKEDLVGDTHGGLVETSQLLALHGDWVDPDYEDLPRVTVETWLEARGESRTQAGRGDPRRLPQIVHPHGKGLAFFVLQRGDLLRRAGQQLGGDRRAGPRRPGRQDRRSLHRDPRRHPRPEGLPLPGLEAPLPVPEPGDDSALERPARVPERDRLRNRVRLVGQSTPPTSGTM